MHAIETKPVTCSSHTGGRLASAFQIATVAASLALGAAFVATLWDVPAAPPPATAHVCPTGPVAC